ncbi:unnamed protein product [Cladocopium goreaui]|uniref:Coiled-coil domain-containing protein 38 n=1 Tax=Cladocopium goreaui TaxID=2562237 RepID=A0A9P1FMH5_9DINO|nr:unnamed protein product [Cladocopium goreaui]
MVFGQLAVLSTLWCNSYAMKILAEQDAADADAVAKCYRGPDQSVWELVMGKQIDIGGASSTLELAHRAQVGPGMKGVELNSNNGGGMRALVRLASVDSMIGVELTKSVVETGRKRTEEEGLSDKIKFINKNSLVNGLPDPCPDWLPGDASADFVYSKDAWCYMPDKQQIIDQAARIVKPGGKVMFTDWIEGEGLSDPEAQRFLSLMTFPAIPTVEEYAQMLKKAGFEVEIAENSGRYSPAMDSYVHMLKRQAVYDAKKLLGWDEEAYDKLISDFEFMANLAQEGKIIQGMFVGRKADVQREMTFCKEAALFFYGDLPSRVMQRAVNQLLTASALTVAAYASSSFHRSLHEGCISSRSLQDKILAGTYMGLLSWLVMLLPVIRQPGLDGRCVMLSLVIFAILQLFLSLFCIYLTVIFLGNVSQIDAGDWLFTWIVALIVALMIGPLLLALSLDAFLGVFVMQNPASTQQIKMMRQVNPTDAVASIWDGDILDLAPIRLGREVQRPPTTGPTTQHAMSVSELPVEDEEEPGQCEVAASMVEVTLCPQLSCWEAAAPQQRVRVHFASSD